MNSHALGALHTLQTGEVVDNADPERRGRLKVRLHAAPIEMWASVVAPSAGRGYGASFVPRLHEVVVVGFITPELPLVLGSIWTGHDSVPEESDPHEAHYVVRTPSSTVMEFDDDDGPKFHVQTRSGYRVTITEGGGGAIEIERGGQSVKLTASEVQIVSSGTVKVEASNVSVSAGMLKVDAGMSKFSGVVQADTVIANAVVSSSYTPGAGNIW